MRETLLIIWNGLKRLALLLGILSVIITMNYAFCDGQKLNKNTKEIERKTDSIKAGKRFKRVDKGNGLQP